MHLILIDDNPNSIKELKAHYESLHWQVSVSTNLKEIEAFIQEGASTILLQQGLRNLSELDMYRLLKAQFQQQLPPCILLSDYASPQSALKFLQAGGQDYIEKPLNFDLLSIKIENVFHKWSEEQLHQKYKNEMEKLSARNNTLLAQNHQKQSIFLSALSQDLKTPLSASIGLCELAKNECQIDEKGLEYIDVIQANIDHIMSLSTDLIQLMEIKNDNIHMVYEHCTIDKLFQKIDRILAKKLLNKGLVIRRQVSSDFPQSFLSDSQYLYRILFHLLENALIYTPQGEINIEAKVKSETEQTWLLEFSVTDTGVGIIDTIQEHIFDCFSRANDPEAKQFGGMGIGLTVCRKLVHALGGEINLRSRDNQGSKFTFTIQALKKDSAEATTWQTHPISNPQKRKVLVCEDCITNQILLSKVLDNIGHEVTLTQNASEAIEAYKNDKPDICIFDLLLPSTSGVELAEQVKRINPDAVIIGLTVSRDKSLHQHALDAGMQTIKLKPISRDELYSSIEYALSKDAKASTLA